MFTHDILGYTIQQLVSLLRERRVSPVELVQACLDSMEATNLGLHAYISVMADQAIEQAHSAERALVGGKVLGPLHGVPISAKDVFETKGMPTTWGVKILEDYVSSEDSTVIVKLRNAGAILLGKTNVDMYPYHGTLESPCLIGPTRNPWDRERTAGRSSGGSAAAVAALLGYGSVGSDSGGSIRIPAAMCGVVGLMPTYGLVSKYRVFPYSLSFDHCGPLARCVYDSALMMNAIAGYDSKDPSSIDNPTSDYTRWLGQSVRGLRVGIPRAAVWEDNEPEVTRLVQDAVTVLAKLGMVIHDIDLPDLRDARWLHMFSALENAVVADAQTAPTKPLDPFDVHILRRRVASRGRVLDWGGLIRQRMRQEYGEIFRRIDLIAMPTVPTTAPRLTEDRSPWQLADEPFAELVARYTRPFNFIHYPAISIPCGFSTQGLPVGLQIVGQPLEEAKILLVAHAYERETGWSLRHPVAL